jgi:hypothetical protein
MTKAITETELRMTDKNDAALEEAREYEAKLKREDNAILDARMEYNHLISGYVSLANMFWVGYGAFFTINSLLATALGVSYSQNAQSMDFRFLILIHVLIPLTGIFISACAICAAVKIANRMRLAEQRGQELESTLLSAVIFHRLHARSAPVWTNIGALFFAALWMSALFAVGKWPF